MNSFLNFLPSSHVSTLGWTLLHSLWQGTLLCLLAALGFYLLRRRPAHSRYALGVSLLAAQLLASVATYLYYLPSAAVSPVTASPVAFPAASSLVSYGVSEAPALPFWLQAQGWLATHLSELVVCWFIGVGLLLLRFVGGWLYLERLRHTSRAVKDRSWNTRFGVLVARLDIRQSVEFRETARILTPMVVGVMRPVVLVPLGLMTGLSAAEAEAILAHELAHIRRYDYLINLLQSLVEVVYFFHPGLWWLSGRIRAEREHCCDDLAMQVCGDRMSLAQALVRVAEFRQEPSLVVAFASSKPLLLRRIRRVLGVSEAPRRRIGGYLPVALVLLSLLVGASVHAYQKENQETEKAPEAKQPKDKKSGFSPQNKVYTIPMDTVIGTPVQVSVDVKEAIDEEIDIAVENQLILADTLREKMAEQHEKMRALHQQMKPYQEEIQALHKQMEPLHRQMENLHLDMEKQRFDVERVQRSQEKMEWKKQQLMEARQKLIEKRGEAMNSKNGQNRLSEADLEKQLASFENQIQTKEQEITTLNGQIAQSRKQMEEVEKPMENLEAEMEKINRQLEGYNEKIEAVSEKMEVIGKKMEMESRKMEGYFPPPPPPAKVKTPKAPAKPAPAPALKGKAAPASVKSPKAPAQSVAPPEPPKKANR